MTLSIRSPEYKDAKRRAKFGGATTSIEEIIESHDFTDAAIASLEKEIDHARAKNSRKSTRRLPFDFGKAIKRNVTGGACACGNYANECDHIVPLEFAARMLRRDMVSLSVYLKNDEIATMSIADFLKSSTNAQGLCGHCNTRKAERFAAQVKRKSFDIVSFLETEAETKTAFRANPDQREAKRAFCNEIERAKMVIRRAHEGPRLDERKLNASNYPTLKEIESRRGACLKHGVHVSKSYFKSFLKDLES